MCSKWSIKLVSLAAGCGGGDEEAMNTHSTSLRVLVHQSQLTKRILCFSQSARDDRGVHRGMSNRVLCPVHHRHSTLDGRRHTTTKKRTKFCLVDDSLCTTWERWCGGENILLSSANIWPKQWYILRDDLVLARLGVFSFPNYPHSHATATV